MKKLFAIIIVAVGLITPASGFWHGSISALPTINWVVEGDSITVGLAGQPSWAFVAFAGMPGVGPSTPNTNTPTSGTVTGVGPVTVIPIPTSGISAITADQNYSTRGGFAYNAAFNLNVLSIMLGTNTSGTSDATAQQKYFWVRDYIRKAQLTGYNRIIVGSMIARDDDGGAFWTNTLVPQNTLMSTYYNSDLRADGYANFASSSLFNTSAAADNTNIYADKVHPTVLGEADMGAIAEPVILAALQAPGIKTQVLSWSVIDADNANGTFSNSNRTVTAASGGTILGFPATMGNNKKYFEVSVDSITAFSGVGIANESFNAAGEFIFRSVNAVSYDNDGNFFINNVAIGTSAAYVSGDLLQFCYDEGTQLIWMRVKHSGALSTWNANASADPVAEIGGYSTSTLSGNPWIHPAATYNGAVTSNFSVAQTVGPIPSGYSAYGP